MSSIYDWSLVSASNANSDADINWAEGQAPSTVNNSARFMMQRLKEFLSDMGAISAAGGSANALSFATKSSFSSYVDGIRFAFRAAADNTSAVTLNANATGAKPVVKFTTEGEAPLMAGEIQAGGIYEVIYSTVLNGAAGGWLILNPTPAQQILPGVMFPFASDVVPFGYLECNGAAVSRTTYSNLYVVIGTRWGVGDGSTTFNLPETRGEFLRGWDHGRGIDATRTFASAQADDFKGHTHTGTTDTGGGNPPAVQSTASATAITATIQNTLLTLNAINGTQFTGPVLGNPHTHTLTTASTGGSETRPRNVAPMFIIKT